MDVKARVGQILIAGAIVGAVDITAACIAAYIPRGITPGVVFRFVASGLFGPDAMQGGPAIAAAGLLFHFIIAIGWTALFFLVYPKLPSWRTSFFTGMGYGLVVWTAMNFIVIPLSRIPSRPFNTTNAIVQLAIHTLLIGGSLSILANRLLSRSAP